ncbi:MAG: AAA family ATPase [Candidatus Pacearchaeota archaeon]
MRLAFVGKGGSGKTTSTALSSLFLSNNGHNVTVIDADLNMHMSELLGLEKPSEEKRISNPKASIEIKKYLIGNNKKIRDIKEFKKTTPPSIGSNLFNPLDKNDFILQNYASKSKNFNLITVGTYDEESIGTSCYHVNLSIFENILSHTKDEGAFIISDMVAGTDAFANTLHSQFDALILVIEPTRKGLSVYEQYSGLAKEAGVFENLLVIGNKIMNEDDKNFILQNIPENKVLGFIPLSEYLRNHEKVGGKLDLSRLEENVKNFLREFEKKLIDLEVSPSKRIKRLHELHLKYSSQESVVSTLGDLSNQIDKSFKF